MRTLDNTSHYGPSNKSVVYPAQSAHTIDHEATSMHSSQSIIMTSEQLAEKKREILRRSNDRLRTLADKSIEYDERYMNYTDMMKNKTA